MFLEIRDKGDYMKITGFAVEVGRLLEPSIVAAVINNVSFWQDPRRPGREELAEGSRGPR